MTSGLPPGWEIRFDAATQKPLYIDHNTKTTHWSPPSSSSSSSPSPTPAPAYDAAAAQAAAQAYHQANPVTNADLRSQLKQKNKAEKMSAAPPNSAMWLVPHPGCSEGCASACCYPSSEAAADLTLIDEVTQLRHGKDHRAVMAEYTRKEGLPNDSNCCMMCCCPEAYAKRCADDRRRRKSTLSAMSMPTSTPGLSSPPAAQPTGAPPSYSAAMATK